MSKTFDERYSKTVTRMTKYLESKGLTMIEWTDDNWWRFTLKKLGSSSISKIKREQKKYAQQNSTSVKR